MQCYACCKLFDPWSMESKYHLDMPDPSIDGAGFRVDGFACPYCHTVHVTIRRGTVAFLEDGYTVSPAEDIAVLTPRVRRVSFDSVVPTPYADIISEARSVLDISPNASAVLVRRLLQLILHDAFGIKKKRLEEEIDEYLTKYPPDQSPISASLHAIRKIGNFGAHPGEVDGVAIDVTRDEADLLIDAVEAMIRTRIELPAREQQINAALSEKAKRFIPK